MPKNTSHVNIGLYDTFANISWCHFIRVALICQKNWRWSHPSISTTASELLFTRLTESMFRLAMVALGGAKSACLLVERSQGVLRQSLLSSSALKGPYLI